MRGRWAMREAQSVAAARAAGAKAGTQAGMPGARR